VKKNLGKGFVNEYYNAIAGIIDSFLEKKIVDRKHYIIVNKLTEEEIKQYQNHRFQEANYKYVRDKEEVNFNLPKLLKKVLKVIVLLHFNPIKNGQSGTLKQNLFD
jgi:predicted phosphohydrolase